MVGKTTVKNVTKDDLADTIQISGRQVLLSAPDWYHKTLSSGAKHLSSMLSSLAVDKHGIQQFSGYRVRDGGS